MVFRKATALGVIVGLVLAGCGDDPAPGSFASISASNDRTPMFAGAFTLQGAVMDAWTSERLGGSDLQMFLIQGTSVRSPSSLHNSSSDPLLGEYVFDGVPLSFNCGNSEYKLVVLKEGYQRFESVIQYCPEWNTTAGEYLDPVDTVYNWVGNIFLFPIGASAPSYSFHVTTPNGEAVPNATVQLIPIVSLGTYLVPTLLDETHVIFPDIGYAPSLTAITDALGDVTFQGTGLMLGGVYVVGVRPVEFEGVQYGISINMDSLVVVPGVPPIGSLPIAQTETTIVLNQISAGNNFGLYVENMSNYPVGSRQPDGALTITFSRPVTLLSNSATVFTATPHNTASTIASVTPTLSADGLMLTLQPVWTGSVAPTEPGVYLEYGELAGTPSIAVVGYEGQGLRIFGSLWNQVTGDTVPSAPRVNVTPL